jgi:mono/diheme cytochrome c family protein
MRKLLKFLGVVLSLVVVVAAGAIAWLAFRSPEMRPPQAVRIDRSAAKVARGKYLVHHVGDCLNCHSDHIAEKFDVPVRPGTEGQGGFTFDKSFGVPGVVAAQNITSDPEHGIGAWSDGEIIRAIREGVNRNGEALFPMMPYQAYRNMSDDDVEAIVAYLRTLPPVKHIVPARKLDFPVNYMIKFAPKPVEGRVNAPDPSKDHLAYGKYLVTIAGCGECHTPKDAHGQPLPGMEFAGGWEMLGPWGRVVTANITPEASTWIGRASKEEFISRFKAYAAFNAENAPAAERGRNTIMPWIAFSGMSEQDLGAIYDYLKTIKPIKHQVVTFPDAVEASVPK